LKKIIFIIKRIDLIILILILVVAFQYTHQNSQNTTDRGAQYIQDGTHEVWLFVNVGRNGQKFAERLEIDGNRYSHKLIIKGKNLAGGYYVKCVARINTPQKSNNAHSTHTDSSDVGQQELSCIKILNISCKLEGDFFAPVCLREEILKKIEGQIPSTQYTLLEGIVLGYQEKFSPFLKHLFNVTGTTHIAVLSGFNISLITSIVYMILSRWLKKIISFAISFIMVVLFISITGWSDSVTRAVIQFVITGIYVIVLNRGMNVIRIFSLMIISVGLFLPEMLFSLSFQLSTLATIGLVFLSDKLILFGGRFRETIAEIGIQTFIANMLTLPVSINVFKNVSVIGIFVNILILPFVEIISIVGLVGCILIWNPIGEILIKISGFLCYYIYVVINFFGRLQIGYYKTDFELNNLGLIVYYLLISSLVLFPWLKFQIKIMHSIEYLRDNRSMVKYRK
jgi:ComEC/Rec2-related protein